MTQRRRLGDGTSARIVDFISKLLPLYIFELRDDIVCARSLRDGTLLIPIDESPEDENGMIEIHWQGDPSRTTVVQGVFVAQTAICQYIQHHTIHKPDSLKGRLEHLAAHFEIKTGESLGLDLEDESSIRELVADLTKRLGVQTVIEIAKKTAGL